MSIKKARGTVLWHHADTDPRVQLHTTFNVSAVATEAGHDGALRIVERIPAVRTGIAWRLTELGKAEGEDIIRELNFNLSE